MSSLTRIRGDILTPNKENHGVLVCHQVNCKGVMGAGLAKQIRERHPSVYRAYKEKCELIQNGVMEGLGNVQYCSVIPDAGYIVVNVFGQDSYGRNRQYTDYDALRKALEKVSESVRDVFRGYVVRIPFLMGCGMAGGDWNEVSKIIEETLVDKGINVEIWSLPNRA